MGAARVITTYSEMQTELRVLIAALVPNRKPTSYTTDAEFLLAEEILSLRGQIASLLEKRESDIVNGL